MISIEQIKTKYNSLSLIDKIETISVLKGACDSYMNILCSQSEKDLLDIIDFLCDACINCLKDKYDSREN